MSIEEKWSEATWNSAVEALSKKCPLRRKVSIKRMPLGDVVGDYQYKKGRHYIRVHKDAETEFAVWILIHETAHARTQECHLEDDHDAHFWIEYGRCYRAVFGAQ